MYAVTHTSKTLLMPILNGLDFFTLSDVMYHFNNAGVCEDILFSIFMEDFSIKVVSTMCRINSAAGVSGLVTEMLLMYKK